ncbi:MAG: 6,7-dimethyl-8-ribityllumazine synthase [Acidimicrobiia bacterium]|nr:6,7-dimethyl-8-ribityllumazine synthase [Acidimicrobiia bacterium]
MIRTIEGNLDGAGLRIGIAVASWNQAITESMLDAAKRRCEENGVSEITVVRVPGALELPVGARALAEDHDAVIAIGAVIKGETDHYDIVVTESTHGVARVALDTGVPVANAILAVHDYAQAVDRAGGNDANKGVEAADAAILTANALRKLRGA